MYGQKSNTNAHIAMLKRVCDLNRRITLVRDTEYVVVCHVNPPRQRVALTRGSAETYGPA